MRGKKQQVRPLPRTFPKLPKLWHPQTFLPSVPVGCGCYGDEREQGWRHAITACPPVAEQYHLSVRSSKILQKPHCFPPQGVQTRGSKSSPYTPPALPHPPHMSHRLPTSLGLFPLPLSALLLRHPLRMFLTKCYSFLPPPPSSACPSVQTSFPCS